MRTLIGRTERRVLINNHWVRININQVSLAILKAQLTEQKKGKK